MILKEIIITEDRINYNYNSEEGTTIYITNLDEKVSKEIQTIGCEKKIIRSIGKIYSKFINKEEVIIRVNDCYVESVNVEAEHINSCILLEKYNVDLYKGSKESPGIDIFMNDYMIYNRVKSKEVGWNFLNEAKHTYSDCIVEVNYFGNKDTFEDEKVSLLKKI